MITYTARVTRQGNDWLGEVPGLAGTHAISRSLSGLRAELANALLLAADLPDNATPDLRLTVAADADDPYLVRAREALELAGRRRDLNRAAESLAEQTARQTRELFNAGWSVRDIAGALDISPGWVSQLIRPPEATS